MPEQCHGNCITARDAGLTEEDADPATVIHAEPGCPAHGYQGTKYEEGK